MPVSGKSAAVSGGRLLDLLEPGWRGKVGAGGPAAGLEVPPDLPLAAAMALGEQSRALSVGGVAGRWPACVIVALAHVAAAAGTGSFWQAWHRAAGLRGSKRSAGEWGSAFLAALRALGLPAAGATAEDAVLAHAVTSAGENQADQHEAAQPGHLAGLRLDPFGGGVLRVDTASGQASPALPQDVAGGRLLAFDADGEPAGRELPAEGVWVLYPATAELRADVRPRTLVTSTLPLTWRGWRLVQLDLRDASWLALHGDPDRRVVRGRTKPALRTGPPIPGVTTVAGGPVFAGLPQVLLPPGPDRWRVEARRAESGALLASVTATGDAWYPDALWRNVPRPLLGELAITVTPGLRRTVVLAEGLRVTAYPMPRLTSAGGLEPAEAVISTPPGMTASPAAVAYGEQAVAREITCVAGAVTACVAVTPPHIRLRIDAEPGASRAASPWHHAGPLRLTSDDLWRGGVLRLDLPGVAVPPPVTIFAGNSDNAGEPVQVLNPTRDGRYPLRRLLDTVTAHGHADLTIAIGAAPVTIATVSRTSHGNDPWTLALCDILAPWMSSPPPRA
jgi:hypothetical protein